MNNTLINNFENITVGDDIIIINENHYAVVAEKTKVTQINKTSFKVEGGETYLLKDGRAHDRYNPKRAYYYFPEVMDWVETRNIEKRRINRQRAIATIERDIAIEESSKREREQFRLGQISWTVRQSSHSRTATIEVNGREVGIVSQTTDYMYTGENSEMFYHEPEIRFVGRTYRAEEMDMFTAIMKVAQKIASDFEADTQNDRNAVAEIRAARLSALRVEEAGDESNG